MGKGGLFPENNEIMQLEVWSNEEMHLVFPNEKFLGEWVHSKIQTLLQKLQHREVEIPGAMK